MSAELGVEGRYEALEVRARGELEPLVDAIDLGCRCCGGLVLACQFAVERFDLFLCGECVVVRGHGWSPLECLFPTLCISLLLWCLSTVYL